MSLRLLCFVALVCFLNLPAWAQLRVSTSYHPDGSRSVTESDVDAGRAEVTVYGPDDRVRSYATHLLDRQGEPTEIHFKDAQKQLTRRVVYQRHASGRVEEELQYLPDGTLAGRIVYQYDTAGRVVNTVIYDGRGRPVQQPGTAPRRRR